MAARLRVISLAAAIACAACTTEELEIPRPPSAFAGFDAFVRAGERVPLDASLSSDPDGDVLAYAWRVQTSPEGSRAVIAAPLERVTSFVADRIGTYVVSLSVSDGLLSSRDLVAFSATASAAPAERPELSLSPASSEAELGARVSIDAIASAAGELEVSLMRVPAGAAPEELALSVSGRAITFSPPRPGEYWLAAVLRGEGVISPPAIATVAVFEDPGPRPRAVLEAPRLVRTNARVLFDGRASEGSPLRLSFTLIADPSGGQDALADVATGCPAGLCRLLLPTAAGVYVVALEAESNGVRGVTAVHAVEVE